MYRLSVNLSIGAQMYTTKQKLDLKKGKPSDNGSPVFYLNTRHAAQMTKKPSGLYHFVDDIFQFAAFIVQLLGVTCLQ